MLNNIVRNLVYSIITILQYLMFFTAIVSWIPQLRGSKLSQILYTCTEPIIAPFRRLLYRIPALQNFPLDMSFLVAYLVLVIVKGILYY